MTGIGPFGVVVAANIERLRRERRLTYVELAARMSAIGRPIPVLGLRRIERHERRVDVDEVVALAAVFCVSLEDLGVTMPACQACNGQPPSGYRCLQCGREAGT